MAYRLTLILFASISLLDFSQASALLVDPMFSTVSSTHVYGTSPDGQGNQIQHSLDLYRPVGPNVPNKLPMAVLMHGGFFTGGGRGSLGSVANEFARRGYIAATIDYRLLYQRPNAPGTLPDVNGLRLPVWLDDFLLRERATLNEYLSEIAAAVSDQGMAVDWMRANAATYNADPNQVIVGGYSAGAVSSLLLGYNAIDGVADRDLTAVVPFAGAMWGLEQSIQPGDPAAFIVHGTADTTVPFSEYPFLQQALDGAGIPSQAHIINGAGHDLDPIDSYSLMFPFLASQITLVPEPSSFMVVACAGGLLALRRRRSA